MLAKLVAMLSLLQLLACSTTSTNQPINKGASKPQTKSLKREKVTPPAESEVEVSCIPYSNDLAELPKFVREQSVVVTEFLKGCTTADGSKGFVKGSPWTVMGFPCTGGGGDVEWKGSRYNPKLVFFNFANSCPMALSDQGQIEDSLREKLGIPTDSKLIAYYPFSVVYWEVDEFEDAGVGFKMELASIVGRRKVWSRFHGMTPVKVKLYGRKNSLLKTKNFYEVHGFIEKDGQENFKFRVDSVQVLKEKSILELKKRCQNLKPRRKCNQFF